MTLSLSHFSARTRFLTAGRATILAVAALSAAPAMAQSGYSVMLTNAPAEAKIMAGGTVFVCDGADCTARESSSSPLRVCTALAKETGPVAAFTFAGKAFDEAKLAKCNANAAG
jgi:hypothetical protein